MSLPVGKTFRPAPTRATHSAFTDDSWVRKIEAELVDSSDGVIRYEVLVEPLSV